MTSPAPPLIDVGILTIRTDEFRAVLEAFPKGHRVFRGQRREYTIRQAETVDGGRYSVAVVRQIEQGNGEAQEAARDLLDDLAPTLLLVVGIAAGLPSDDITLGDVVVSTRVNEYTVEARKAREKTTYNISGGPIAKELQARVANLVGRERDLGRWTAKLPDRPRVSWSREGQLYGPKRWQTELREKLEAHFGRGTKPRPPTFVTGAIASSDRLVKDPKVLIPWLDTARHLQAIEMEAAGVYRAARERCLMLAIRGISDIVGLKRNDAWTKYACLSAAAFARAFLRTAPIAPKLAKLKEQAAGKVAEDRAPGGATQIRRDTLYLNMAPLLEYPDTVFVAPSNCGSLKQAWGRLLASTRSFIPHAWVLHGENLLSFVDPSSGPLSSIVDTTRVEAHETSAWAASADRDKQRIFVQLLGGALRDDLGPFGIRFAPDDHVYFFAGKPNEPPRRYAYKNARVASTLTVVSKYPYTTKDGVTGVLLRHLALQARFRAYEGIHYLEITPTYRFTTDGRQKSGGHERNLSRIKRIERNRSVLSQVLLWSNVLCAESRPDRPQRLLRFARVPSFEIAPPIGDDELTSVDTLLPDAVAAQDDDAGEVVDSLQVDEDAGL